MFLSAITSPEATSECEAERRVRQLAMLRRLSEIGMALAEIAGRDALRDAEETSAAVPPVSPEPRRRDPKVLFARLASGVRQAIAMERRVAAGEFLSVRRPSPASTVGVSERAVHPDVVIAGIAAVIEIAAVGLAAATGRDRLMSSSAGMRIEGLERASVPASPLSPRKTGPPVGG